jgi:hypothetical protein
MTMDRAGPAITDLLRVALLLVAAARVARWLIRHHYMLLTT